MAVSLPFDSTLGAAFCGFTVAAVLFGIFTSQVYTYFQRYPSDKPGYKFLVLSLWVLECFHQILIAHSVYYYSITNFNNPLALLFPVWTIISQVVIGAFIAVTVKSCFALRVWRFSRGNIFLTGLILCLNVAEMGLAIVFTIRAFQLATFADVPKLKVLTTITLSVSAAADWIIAISLCYFLCKLKSGYSQTNVIVNILIRYAVETGLATSVCGIATLVSFDTMPTNFVFMSFYFVYSKLYSNSLLVTLNTRKTVHGQGVSDTRRDTVFTLVNPTSNQDRSVATIMSFTDAKSSRLAVEVRHEIRHEVSDAPIHDPDYVAYLEYTGQQSEGRPEHSGRPSRGAQW